MAPEIKRRGRSFSAARRRTGTVCEFYCSVVGKGTRRSVGRRITVRGGLRSPTSPGLLLGL